MLNRCPSGRDAMLGTVEDLIANSFHQLQYDKIKMGVIKEMVFGKPSRLIRSTIWLSYYTSLNLVISCTEGQFEAEHVIRNSFPLFFYEKGMPQMTQKITRLENEATLLYSSGELHRLGVFDTHVAARGCHVEMVGARNGMFDVGIEPQASISDATSRILKTHVQVSQDSDLDVLVKMRDNWTDWDLAVVVNLVKKPISCGTLLPALSAFRSTNYIVDTVLHCSSSHVALSEIVQKITRLENEATLLKSAEEGKVRDVNVMKNSQASGIVLPALSASHCDNYIVDTLIQCSSDFSKKGSRSKGCPPQSGEKVKMHVVSRGWTRPCVLLASIIMMLLLVSAESIPDGVCPVNRITSIVDETCPLHQYEPKRLIATSEYWIDEYVDTELFQCKKPVLPDQSWIQQIDILLQRDDHAETKKEHIIDIAETKNEQTDHCPIKSWQDVIISLIGLLSNVVTNLGPLIICCQIGNLNDKQRQLLVGSTFSFLAAHCFWISYLSGQDCVDLWKCVSSGVAIALNVGYQIFFWIKIRKMNPKSLIGSLACMAIIIVASALTGKFQVIAAGILGVIFNAFAHIMRFLASGREWNGMAFTIACSGVLSSSLFWHKVDWAVEVCYKIGCLTSLFFRGVDAILLLYYLWEHCTEKRLPMVNNDGGHKKNRHVPNQFTQPQASVANVQATSMDVAPRGSSSVPPRRGIQDEQLDPQALAPHALPPTVPAPRPADSTTPKPPDSTPPKAPAAAVDHKSDTTNDPKTSDAVDPKPAAAADLKSSDPTDAKPAIAAPDAKPASLADRDSSDVTGAKPAEPEAGGRR
ncbi:hypothetical protein EJB05_15848 [Eragrostis curvula]|uniref:Uncharacterized protein n=1 Tax=Eragrostis curvula TaxID=38414 RepID=A0A5J9VF25_9POAL|nr:hypothetical protein EJB05_15848 [Eragrostis curvula]